MNFQRSPQRPVQTAPRDSEAPTSYRFSQRFECKRCNLRYEEPEPRLFSADLRERATQRRVIREADAYFATAMEHLLEAIAEKKPAEAAALRAEIARWEAAITGDFLAGALSAADLTLYPMAALLGCALIHDRARRRHSLSCWISGSARMRRTSSGIVRSGRTK